MQHNASLIKQKAQELGFFHCGISRADFLEEEAPRLENWLKNGFHGKMGYMENHFDKRLDPRLLVDGAKSVITLLFNYYTDAKPLNEDTPRISTYAYGDDYHQVVKEKLFDLFVFVREMFGDVQGRDRKSVV